MKKKDFKSFQYHTFRENKSLGNTHCVHVAPYSNRHSFTE